MVTPTTGTLNLVGLKTKQTFNCSFYISDVVGANVTFEPAGTATSSSQTSFVPSEPMMIYRASIKTGPTVTTGILLNISGSPIPGALVDITTYLSTNPTPPPINIRVPAGLPIGAKQV